MKIIALSGKRESGKTTVADYLAANHGAVKLSFAKTLREEVVSFGYKHELIFGKPTHPDVRNLLIAHGSLRRMQDQDYWIDRMFKTMTDLPHDALVVVDDVRYWNEAERLGRAAATLVRVVMADPLYRMDFIRGVDDHVSETDLDQWSEWDDMIIAKHGDIDWLCRQASEIVEGQS